MKNETAVRTWMRKTADAAGVTIEWTETTTRGSTPGQADVRFLFSDVTFPIELKNWDRLKNGMIGAKMRREQVRYHYRMQLNKVKTVLAWGMSGEKGIWVLPGFRAPRAAVSRIDDGQCFWFAEDNGAGFLRYLISEHFWANDGYPMPEDLPPPRI